MKKQIGYFFALISIIGTSVMAQVDDSGTDVKDQTFMQRLLIGGSAGAQFGTTTYIDISPTVGYKVTNRLVAGIGMTYKYYKNKSYGYNYETDIYGGSLWSRYYILYNLFAHGEFEMLSLNYPDGFGTLERRQVQSIMLGAGYRQQIGNSSFFNIMLLYNFNESVYSPYVNPIIRMGFDIGF